jgi:hypothetical protein
MYCHIVAVFYCDIVVLSYWSVVLYCHIVVLLYCDIVVLSYCSVMLYWHIVVLLYCDIVMLSYCSIVLMMFLLLFVMLLSATDRGSRSIFLPDSKISGGIIGRVRPKKGVPNPNYMPTQESPTLTPLPPLAKIGHQLYHGGGSISSNATLTKKCPCQRITYLLGSTLTRAFLFMCCFCCEIAFFTQKHTSMMI